MTHDSLLTTDAAFHDLCDEIEQAGIVAFDTEFVSEFTYRPELCLLQFAVPGRSVAVDPYEVHDLSRWWKIMADGKVDTIVHGSREEVRFCMRFAGARPGRMWDVQIAEGLQCRGYPLGYTALVARVLGKSTKGKETRTDWRRRPLTDRQVEYALEDVDYLIEVATRQRKTLGSRGRVPWVETEVARFLDDLEAELTRENWRKLPGATGLSPRENAVARELWLWREKEAETQDRPARKILRDDLIIELARRQPTDVADLLATRDMNRSDYRRVAPVMIAAIERALALPNNQLPTNRRSEKEQDEHILAQLLAIALANRCAEQNVALPLVGTTADLKQLVRWQVYGDRSGERPKLLAGWRAEVCGDLLTDVLAGKISLRVSDPHSEHPLTFERLG